MPAITATSIKSYGTVAVTETTLDGSDSLTYKRDALLNLRNPTGSPISPSIDGADGTTVSTNGLGIVDVSSGYSVGSIAAGNTVSIRLDTINEYLRGTIAVTSGTGLVATLLES